MGRVGRANAELEEAPTPVGVFSRPDKPRNRTNVRGLRGGTSSCNLGLDAEKPPTEAGGFSHSFGQAQPLITAYHPPVKSSS